MGLDEVKKSTVSCIYRITFPDGKCYVGQTKNLRERVELYERNVRDTSCNNRLILAIRTAGIENLCWDILAQVSTRDADDLRLCLSILEIKYIRECGSISPKGYNVSIGGELLGIPADFIETKFGVTSSEFGCKPVLVYDSHGNFVSEHPSVARCAYALGVKDNEVSSCLKKSLLVKGTYMVREKRYGDVPKRIAPFVPAVSVRHIVKTECEVVKRKVYKKVEIKNAAIMYNRDGEYVGLFDNESRARQFLRLDNSYPFGKECKGKYIFHYNGGEIRKNIGKITSRAVNTVLYDDILAYGDVDDIGERISFHSDEESSVVTEVKKKKRKTPKEKSERKHREIRAVECYSLTRELIDTYPSILDASDSTGLTVGAIRSCVQKANKRAGDFVFRYVGDDSEFPSFSETTLRKHDVKKKD